MNIYEVVGYLVAIHIILIYLTYIPDIYRFLVKKITKKTKATTTKAELIMELWNIYELLLYNNDKSILEEDELLTRQNQLLEEYVLLTNYEPSENHELVGFVSDMPIEREKEKINTE